MPPKRKDETNGKTQKNGKESRDVKNDSTQGEKKAAKDCTQHWEDAVQLEKNQKDYKDFKENDARAEKEDNHGEDGESGSKKRGHGANQKGQNKRPKKGATKDGPRAAAGDKTRVPKEGQQVQWHALPGYVEGEVVEVVYEDKTVEGKSIKASKEDPRIVLKSASSGKIAVHKPEAVFFD